MPLRPGAAPPPSMPKNPLRSRPQSGNHPRPGESSRLAEPPPSAVTSPRGHLVRARLRLSAWTIGLLLLATAGLFAATTLSLVRTLTAEEDARMSGLVLRHWAAFRLGGEESLAEILRQDGFAGEEFYVRIADSADRTLAIRYPGRWASFGLDRVHTFDSPEAILTSDTVEYTIRITQVPLSDQLSLQIGISTERRLTVLSAHRSSFVTALVAVLPLSFVAALFVVGRYLRPLEHLSRAVHDVLQTGRFDQAIAPTRRRDELALLAESFNRMLAKLNDVVVELRTTLDTVAHDVRTPITRLQNAAEVSLASSTERSLREGLGEAVEQSRNIVRMLDTIMDISALRAGIPADDVVTVGELFAAVADVYEFVAADAGVGLSVEPVSQTLRVAGSRGHLQQAVANLVDNAIKYTDPGGSVSLSAESAEGVVVISVRDTGRGIPEDEIGLVWDRLRRGSGAMGSAGHGLGLSLVRAIVTAHRGIAEIVSNPGEGTEVTIRIPQTDEASADHTKSLR